MRIDSSGQEHWNTAELALFRAHGRVPEGGGVSAPPPKQLRDKTEAVFQSLVIKLLEQAGYAPELIYHTHDSRRSNPGFCDIVAIRPSDHHRKWIECKTEKGQPSAEQYFWLMELQLGGEDASLLRPSDLADLITEIAVNGM